MTNLQLMLSIGVPSLLILLSWMQQGARTSRLEATMDRKFEAIDRQFEAVARQFVEMRQEMIALRDSIHRDMVALHERVAVVETKHS